MPCATLERESLVGLVYGRLVSTFPAFDPLLHRYPQIERDDVFFRNIHLVTYPARGH
jgi:hypothetical protein